MRRKQKILVSAPSVVLAVVLTLLLSVSIVSANHGRNFTAHLTGAQEVGPVQTLAQGQAHFRVSKDGSAIDFKLNVANIENVRAAHIHCAPVGSNGGVAVNLLSSYATGRTNGTIAQGTISSDGSFGCAETFKGLLELMANGGAYVNVHTSTNPSGEIRGQIG